MSSGSTISEAQQQQRGREREQEEAEHFYALSQDGPMGFTNVLFIQSIVGCADSFPENPFCVAVIDAMKRIVVDQQGSSRSRETIAKKGFSKEWAEFVQAVLDGKLHDSICETLLRGASVKPIGGSENSGSSVGEEPTFDFVLSSRAVDLVAETMPELHVRFAKVMQKMVCNQAGGEEEEEE